MSADNYVGRPKLRHVQLKYTQKSPKYNIGRSNYFVAPRLYGGHQIRKFLAQVCIMWWPLATDVGYQIRNICYINA